MLRFTSTPQRSESPPSLLDGLLSAWTDQQETKHFAEDFVPQATFIALAEQYKGFWLKGDFYSEMAAVSDVDIAACNAQRAEIIAKYRKPNAEGARLFVSVDGWVSGFTREPISEPSREPVRERASLGSSRETPRTKPA